MLKLACMLILVAGCFPTTEDDESFSDDGVGDTEDGDLVATDPDVDTDTDEDSGMAEQADGVGEPVWAPGRLDGQMTADYTYSGSLGEFTEPCSGDAFITIDEDDVIEGEGTCANDFISFGFVIEGAQVDGDLSGNLIGESAAGRAETPFEGSRSEGEALLVFDHTHAADGESLRLVGTINLVVSE